ncbi:MAG TPA: PD-(D/E)XK nuclease family protein [Candidatus Binatia bacterium]|nr:PD-(D/E)XK nuclease family protein [Candidatus Binatia bacterium]
MAPTRRLFVNGSFAVLEAAAIELLRTLQRAHAPLAPLWVIVPTNLLRLQLGRAMAAGTAGHANLRCLTLLDLARELGEVSLLTSGARALSELAALALIRRLLRERPTVYFAALADRPGLPAALLATFNDLADGEVDAPRFYDFATALPSDSASRDRLEAVAQLYRAYREELERVHLYDRNDLLLAAAERAPVHRPPGGQVILYGFYDFTPLQRRLVAAVVRGSDAIAFMPWEEGPRFAYATPTLTWLRSLGFALTLLADAPDVGSDVARAQRRVFDGPSELPSHSADGTLRVISAPGEGREVREIVRKILELVRVSDWRFDAIGVLLRARDPYAGELIDCLQRCGIPVYCEGGRPLTDTAAGRALLLLLRVLQEDFARPAVIEFATTASIPFTTLMADGTRCTPAQWDVLSAEAGIVAGAAQWTDRLAALRRRYATQQRDDEEPAPGLAARLGEIERCERFIKRLATDLAAIPRRGPWQQIVPALLDTFSRYVEPSDTAELIRRTIAPLATLDDVAGDAAIADLAAAVISALSSGSEPVGTFGSGVFVGDIMPARGLSFRAAIIPGLVERTVPRPIAEDPLLRDEERQHLGERSGLFVAPKAAGVEEERLLFTLMLRSAQAAAVLTFPRLDTVTARDRLPSLFLLQTLTAVAGRRASYREFDEWDCVRRVELSRLLPPSLDDAIDRFEANLVRAGAVLQTGDVAALQALLACTFFATAVRAEMARGRPELTTYDGVFVAPIVLQRLSAADWTLSARRVQAYLTCPFRFFLEHILQIEALDEPERIVTVSALSRGNLVHGILHLFYERAVGADLVPLCDATRDRAEALMDDVATIRCRELEAEGLTGLPLAWQHQQRVLRRILRAFIAAEIDGADDFLPARFEQHFGDEAGAVRVELPDGEMVRLRGRIDRMDLAADGRGRVIDYKTSRASEVASDVIEPATVQLPFYLHAVRTLFPERRWTRADLLFVNADTTFARAGLDAAAPAAQTSALAAVLASVMRGIRCGYFPAGAPTCRYCAFPAVCGRAPELYRMKTGNDGAS